MYDCIVLGLGISGLCTTYSIAKRGINVLGIEQFSDEKSEGSSRGPSRITRQAYFLGPDSYYPLIKDSFKLWEELESKTGIPLFKKTGVIYWDSKTEDYQINKVVIDTAIKNGYPIEILNQQEAKVKEPFFKLKEKDYYAVIEKEAGILLAHNCNKAVTKVIREDYSSNCSLLYNTKIVNIKKEGFETYVLTTSEGKVLKCRHLVLTPGSWIVNLFDFFSGLKPYRKFFKIEPALVIHFKFKEEKLNSNLTKPFYIGRKVHHIYGFPDLQDGNYMKIGIFHYYFNDEKNFEKVDHFDEDNFNMLESIARDYINQFDRKNIEIISYCRCSYTMTPDEDYVIDRIPLEDNAYIVSACSGHGYKFQNTIGEHVAKLILKEEKVMNSFKLSRFEDKEQKTKF